MRSFAPYVNELRSLLSDVTEGRCAVAGPRVRAALDGQAAARLRELVSITDRRQTGAFFTNSTLARRALRSVLPTLAAGSVVVDPACGAGDLLLGCLPTLMRFPTARAIGRDVEPAFIGAARHRVQLALLATGAALTEQQRFDLAEGCSLDDHDVYRQATHVLMNPPFTLMTAPVDIEWCGGSVNAAAVFVAGCLGVVAPGTRLCAILPDVLRSGSRYTAWRSLIEKKADVLRIDRYGQFDPKTDVDVFILHAQARKGDAPKGSEVAWVPRSGRSRTVGDFFTVSVGSVVNFRDPHAGPQRPYLHSRGLATWETVHTIQDTRLFGGPTVKPPFVAVRRTSRPGDERARATIISGPNPVAVDNHLLVFVPRSGGLASCRALMTLLRDRETSKWLDRRIRCRHLTVGAMRDVPWRKPQ